jgi:hypothetical protein
MRWIDRFVAGTTAGKIIIIVTIEELAEFRFEPGESRIRINHVRNKR